MSKPTDQTSADDEPDDEPANPTDPVDEDADEEAAKALDKRRIDAVLDALALPLAEHFDSVLIIATRSCPFSMNDKQTRISERTVGNWYASFGAAKTWVTHHDELTREECRKQGEI